MLFRSNRLRLDTRYRLAAAMLLIAVAMPSFPRRKEHFAKSEVNGPRASFFSVTVVSASGRDCHFTSTSAIWCKDELEIPASSSL